MSKRTRTSLYRKYEYTAEHGLVKREKEIPAFPNAHARCPRCKSPVVVSPGQIIKRCRVCKKMSDWDVQQMRASQLRQLEKVKRPE